MKIIGENEKEFILAADKNEVANIVGFYSVYSNGYKLKVGDSIEVNNIYNQMYQISRNQETLKCTSKVLRDVANLLEIHDPVIRSVNFKVTT